MKVLTAFILCLGLGAGAALARQDKLSDEQLGIDHLYIYYDISGSGRGEQGPSKYLNNLLGLINKDLSKFVGVVNPEKITFKAFNNEIKRELSGGVEIVEEIKKIINNDSLYSGHTDLKIVTNEIDEDYRSSGKAVFLVVSDFAHNLPGDNNLQGFDTYETWLSNFAKFKDKFIGNTAVCSLLMLRTGVSSVENEIPKKKSEELVKESKNIIRNNNLKRSGVISNLKEGIEIVRPLVTRVPVVTVDEFIQYDKRYTNDYSNYISVLIENKNSFEYPITFDCKSVVCSESEEKMEIVVSKNSVKKLVIPLKKIVNDKYEINIPVSLGVDQLPMISTDEGLIYREKKDAWFLILKIPSSYGNRTWKKWRFLGVGIFSEDIIFEGVFYAGGRQNLNSPTFISNKKGLGNALYELDNKTKESKVYKENEDDYLRNDDRMFRALIVGDVLSGNTEKFVESHYFVLVGDEDPIKRVYIFDDSSRHFDHWYSNVFKMLNLFFWVFFSVAAFINIFYIKDGVLNLICSRVSVFFAIFSSWPWKIGFVGVISNISLGVTGYSSLYLLRFPLWVGIIFWFLLISAISCLFVVLIGRFAIKKEIESIANDNGKGGDGVKSLYGVYKSRMNLMLILLVIVVIISLLVVLNQFRGWYF